MKQRIKSLSIHNKLTLLIVVISMTVLGVSTAVFYKNQIQILELSIIEKSLTQASFIGASVESSIIFGDERSAEKIIDLLHQDDGVEFASVILPDRSIFSQYSKTMIDKSPNIDFSTKIKLSRNYLDIVHEIKNSGDLLGYIYIRSNLNDLNTQRSYYQKTLFLIVIFSILIAYILAHYLQKIITVPIDHLVSYVKELSVTKNYNKRLELNLQDELGTLMEGFNAMLDTVQQHERELKNHSDNLQKIVDQRTKQLYQRAHFDSLTNLPNRALLLDRLDHAVATARRKKSCLAILFMDLDRFKIINDSLGHDVGDQLLQSVATRLLETCRESDTVARLGGDEFVFLMEQIDKPTDPGRLAKKVNDAFSLPFQLENHLLHVSTSIGICLYPEDGEDSKTLLKNADISMYHSKEAGAGGYCFYKQKMNQLVHERLEMENVLRGAQERNEFYLMYQPQVTLETNTINKVEALLRWESPLLGSVSPAIFIPIAEEIGLINSIGTHVISQACKQLFEWRRNGVDNLSISVNISSSHLLSVDLADHITNEVNKFGVRYEQLEIEITEEVFLEQSERTITVLKKLQMLGIRIAIDDFGTGYSSLQYLKDLPVDTLKLDGMFVRDLQSNFASQGIASSTITLAHSLNMQIVAECVETQEQLDFLKLRGCDLIQGYYFYKPLPAAEILTVMNHH